MVSRRLLLALSLILPLVLATYTLVSYAWYWLETVPWALMLTSWNLMRFITQSYLHIVPILSICFVNIGGFGGLESTVDKCRSIYPELPIEMLTCRAEFCDNIVEQFVKLRTLVLSIFVLLIMGYLGFSYITAKVISTPRPPPPVANVTPVTNITFVKRNL
jgi:hypothetical protein